MQKKGMSLYVGVFSLVLTLLILIILEVARISMILSIGIVATDNIRAILVWFFGTIGVIFTGIGLYQLVKGSALERLKKSSLAYRAKTSGQKEIREQLEIMMGMRPKLRGEISRCLDQLNALNSQLNRFNQLIKSNEAESVSGAIVGLKEIEQTLCFNFKGVINSSVAAEEDSSAATDKNYKESRARIRHVIEANSFVLDKGNEFLLAIADNISQIEAGSDTVLLDSWLKVIREQNKQSMIALEEKV